MFAGGVAGLGGVRDELKSDRVAAELERRIISGKLAPGERLPTEGELGELLDVSRSVVRDAIRSLVARGLIVVRQGLGMTVAIPSDAAFGHALLTLLARSDLTMGDVINARAAIETRLVPLAAESGTEADWEALEETYLNFGAAVDGQDWDTARDAHLEFHVRLLRALHQPALEILFKPMTEVILVSSTPPRRTAREDWEVESHGPIIDALKSRDAAAVEQAMADHFAAVADPKRYKTFRARPFHAAVAAGVGIRP